MVQPVTSSCARRFSTLLLVGVLVVGLTACGDETAEPGADQIAEDAVAVVEERVDQLEERVEALEEGAAPTAVDAEEGLAADEQAFGADQLAVGSDRFIGEEVTVSGTVSSVVGAHAFTIGEAEDLLVVSSEAVSSMQVDDEGAAVEVVGTVREGFAAADVGEELGVDLGDPSIYAEWENDNYIVAEEVSEALENGQ